MTPEFKEAVIWQEIARRVLRWQGPPINQEVEQDVVSYVLQKDFEAKERNRRSA